MTKPPTPSGKLEPVNMLTIPTTVGVLTCFWFCLKTVRLVQASTLMVQLDSMSVGSSVTLLPSSPPFCAQTTFPPQPFQFSDLGQALSYIGLRTPLYI